MTNTANGIKNSAAVRKAKPRPTIALLLGALLQQGFGEANASPGRSLATT
jgi:hypothetical protein